MSHQPLHRRADFRRRSILAGFGILAAGQLGTANAASSQNGVIVGKEGWLFLAYDLPNGAAQARMRQVCDIINQGVGLLRRAGIETVVALTPAKTRIYSDFLPDDVRMQPEVAKRYPLALEMLRQSGALVPDLDAALRTYRQRQSQDIVFFKTDTHWTAAGAECAAQEIARQIREKLLLPPSRRPGTDLGAAVRVAHSGNDLLNLLPSELRRNYQAEWYPVHQPAAVSKVGLLDNDGADVAVVGNSYMQARYNFSPMLSNQLKRPVSLVWKYHPFGPYRTLLDYLGSSMFRQSKPRVLVWTFHEADTELPTNNSAWTEGAAMPPQAFLDNLRQVLRV